MPALIDFGVNRALLEEPEVVRIERTTIRGNTLVIGREGDRTQPIAKNREHGCERILPGHVDVGELATLRGKRLVCAPKPCHVEVLAAAARRATDCLAAHKSAR